MSGSDRTENCCVIYNPSSNRGCNARHVQRLQRLHARDPHLRWMPTDGPGDAERIATYLAEEGCPHVIAMGGDGTVHEVVNGLMAVASEQRPCMGVVPAGAGNDFAHVVGLPRTPEAALHRALDGSRFSVDVGRISGPPLGHRHWINSVGSMLDGAINMESHRWKRPRGPARYVFAALRMLATPFPVLTVRLRVDGTEQALSLVLLTVANGPREGGISPIAPAARLDDGRFDYVAVDAISRAQMIALLPRLLTGSACRGRRVHCGQGVDMSVEADGPLIIHLDGELWARPDDGVAMVTIELLPSALQVCR